MIHQVKFITHSLFWTGAVGKEREKKVSIIFRGANKNVINSKTRFLLIGLILLMIRLQLIIAKES